MLDFLYLLALIPCLYRWEDCYSFQNDSMGALPFQNNNRLGLFADILISDFAFVFPYSLTPFSVFLLLEFTYSFATLQSLRVVATRLAARRTAVIAAPRRSASTFPKLGTEAEMIAEATQQIRARVKYQKELVKLHAHDPAEEVAEMFRWVNITFMVGLPICALSLLYSFIMDEHEHRVEGAMPEYMTVRSKEFPWECGECDLFDIPCWDKCRAAKKA